MNNKFVIGNWKMHGDMSSIIDLVQNINNNLPKNLSCTCVVLPPAIFIPKVAELTQNTSLNVGAQNLYPSDSGAFTGEISGKMLLNFSCKYVLVGHSERRHLLNESDKFIAEKFHYAKQVKLVPIFCVGETLSERENGLTTSVITRQLQALQDNLDKDVFNDCIIAYEPVWAIGTGKTASPDQAQEIHYFIRKLIKNDKIPILYGGSVNENNASELFAKPDIDGGLIGGASLDYIKFLKIINSANH